MASINALNQTPVSKMKNIDAKFRVQDACSAQNVCSESTTSVMDVDVAVGIEAYMNTTQPVISSWCDSTFPPQPEPSQSTSIKKEVREVRRLCESGLKFYKEFNIQKKFARSVMNTATNAVVDAKDAKANKHKSI